MELQDIFEFRGATEIEGDEESPEANSKPVNLRRSRSYGRTSKKRCTGPVIPFTLDRQPSLELERAEARHKKAKRHSGGKKRERAGAAVKEHAEQEKQRMRIAKLAQQHQEKFGVIDELELQITEKMDD